MKSWLLTLPPSFLPLKNDISCVLDCLLLNYDFTHCFMYILIDIKFISSEAKIFFRNTKFSWKKIYLLRINVYAEIYFKYDYQQRSLKIDNVCDDLTKPEKWEKSVFINFSPCDRAIFLWKMSIQNPFIISARKPFRKRFNKTKTIANLLVRTSRTYKK